MVTCTQSILIFTILVLAMTNYVVANYDCPDNSNASLHDPTGCPTGDVSVLMLAFPPYVIFKVDDHDQIAIHGIVSDYLYESFERCCPGNGSSGGNLKIVPVDEVDDETLMKADIIFPVTGKVETFLTFSGIEYTFHDIVKSQGFVLIGLIDQYNAKARGLVLESLYDSWPIFVLTFLLAGIAGIFIWALEFHVKNEEFPLSFTKGSYEGFWWAFISMTTVGYGDKTPRSFFGRLFGVLWILLGLIVITMFTATVTSALTHSSSPEYTNALEGQEVAVFYDSNAEAEASYLGATPHREYCVSFLDGHKRDIPPPLQYLETTCAIMAVIAKSLEGEVYMYDVNPRNGALVRQTSNQKAYKDFHEMHEDLFDYKVEGIFMERLPAFYYYKDKVDDDEDDNLRVFDTVSKEIPYKMALKRNTTCNFFQKNFCLRRRLENPLIDSLVKRYTTPIKSFKPSKDIEGLLSGDSQYTAIFLFIVMGILLGLLAIGIVVDVFIRKSGQRLCKPILNDKSQRTASDVNIVRVNATLRQLEGLEQNLEKLFTQVQTMKENLTSTTDNSLKLAEL